jgi:hypothetical protein
MISEANPLLYAPRSAAERWPPCISDQNFRYQGACKSNLGLFGMTGIFVKVDKFCPIENMSLYLMKGSTCRSLSE